MYTMYSHTHSTINVPARLLPVNKLRSLIAFHCGIIVMSQSFQTGAIAECILSPCTTYLYTPHMAADLCTKVPSNYLSIYWLWVQYTIGN